MSVNEFASVLNYLLRGNAATASSVAGKTAASHTATLQSPVGTPYTGFTPNYPFEGFDFAREQNPGKSAKDAFAYLANQAPPPPFEDKAALGRWFTQHIQPGMEQLGHRIERVTGDKFTFTNWQGTFEIDFVRGAGAPGASFAWQGA